MLTIGLGIIAGHYKWGEGIGVIIIIAMLFDTIIVGLICRAVKG